MHSTKPSLLTANDLHLFNEGSHFRLYDVLGAHLLEQDGAAGAQFAVWAPNAARVSVVGEFNGWSESRGRLQQREQSGIWEGFVTGAKREIDLWFSVS